MIGSGFRVQGVGFRVQGSGFWVGVCLEVRFGSWENGLIHC